MTNIKLYHDAEVIAEIKNELLWNDYIKLVKKEYYNHLYKLYDMINENKSKVELMQYLDNEVDWSL